MVSNPYQKIDAIKNIAPPKTKQELYSFIGVNWSVTSNAPSMNIALLT